MPSPARLQLVDVSAAAIARALKIEALQDRSRAFQTLRAAAVESGSGEARTEVCHDPREDDVAGQGGRVAGLVCVDEDMRVPRMKAKTKRARRPVVAEIGKLFRRQPFNRAPRLGRFSRAGDPMGIGRGDGRHDSRITINP